MKGRQDSRRLHAGPAVPALENQLAQDLEEFRRGHGLDAAWILVPSLDMRRRLRKLLADKTGSSFNVRFVLFPDLAREVLAAGASGESPARADSIDQPGKAPVSLNISAGRVLLRGWIERGLGSKSYFGDVRDRGGFIEALLGTLDDLDHAGLAPEAVREAAERAGSSTSSIKMMELSRIQAEWLREVGLRGYQTAAGLIKSAAASASHFPEKRFWIYGFYDWNGVQRRFLESLFRGRDVTVYFPEVAAADQAYAAPAREWLRAQGFVFPPVAEAPPEPREIRIFSAAGERREVEEATRRVLRILEETACPPDRIALVYRNKDPYAPLLATVLSRAGLPAACHDRPALGEIRVARALRLFVCAALSNGSRQRVMDFLDVVLPIHPRLAPDGVALAARWNEFTVQAGITRGSGNWLPRLSRLRDSESKRSDFAAAPGGPASGPVRESLAGEAGRGSARQQTAGGSWRLRALDDFIGEISTLLEGLDAFLAAPSWSGRTAVLLDAAERWIGPDPLRDEVLAAVSALADLDRTGVEVDAARFQDTLEDLLASTSAARVDDRRSALHVGDILSIRGLDFEHIFMLGMAEKIFPRTPQQDPILLDRERRLLNGTDGTLPIRGDALAEEDYLFALLRAAGRRLTLSFSRVEPAESRPRLPSPYLLRVASQATGALVDYEGLENRIERVPLDLMAQAAHAGRLRPAELLPVEPRAFLDPAAAIDLAELDGLLAAAAAGAGRPSRVAGICAESPVLVRAVEGDVARWRDRVFTRFDGMIESAAAREAMAALERGDGAYSASRLEMYARCPFRYFIETFLGVRSSDDPEDLDGASPMDRGVLVHEILREFLSARREVVLSTVGRDVLRQELLTIARRCIGEFEGRFPTGHALRWAVDRASLEDDLVAWLDFELSRPPGAVARGFEVSFGMASGEDGHDNRYSSPEPAILSLPGGREIAFHGRIDRFDYDPARRHARVVDYKSSRPRGAASKGLNGGRNLQLPIYLLALSRLVPDLESAEAEYIYLRNDPTTAGYAASNFESLKGDLAETVAPLVEGIEAGRFFALPTSCGFREECDYASICGVRVQERFERKASDPRIASHPALVERTAR